MKALALNGIAFKGQPLLVQASMAEKNRLAQAAKNMAAANAMMGGGAAPPEPRKLMVSELHAHIGAADLREVFSPFGELEDVTMADGGGAYAGLGIAYVTFVNAAEARDAQVGWRTRAHARARAIFLSHNGKRMCGTHAHTRTHTNTHTHTQTHTHTHTYVRTHIRTYTQNT
eukprot:6018086-Pleurochrysis_carterae.AAC.1